MPATKLNNRQLPDTLSNKTLDSTNNINTTTVRLKITGGSNGQVLSTDGFGNLSWVTVAGSDIDLGTFYDFGTFNAPASYNFDLGVF
jgi:hypothetical protein